MGEPHRRRIAAPSTGWLPAASSRRHAALSARFEFPWVCRRSGRDIANPVDQFNIGGQQMQNRSKRDRARLKRGIGTVLAAAVAGAGLTVAGMTPAMARGALS